MKKSYKKTYYKSKKDNSIAKTRKDVNQDKRIDNVEKKIKKINATEELKYVQAAFVQPTTAGALALLNGMAIGSDQISRIGAQIQMTSIMWHYRLICPTTIGPFAYRILIVVDRQPNGVALTPSGNPLTGQIAVLNNVVLTSEIDSFTQYENKKRFKVLHDNRGCFNAQTTDDASTGYVAIEKAYSGYKKLGLMTKYGDDLTGIGSINTNSVYLIAYATVNTLTMLGGSRIYFKDA